MAIAVSLQLTATPFSQSPLGRLPDDLNNIEALAAYIESIQR